MKREESNAPAAVVGLGVNGFGVVRSLGRVGIPVIGLYSDESQPGRFSRYCRAQRISPLDSSEALDDLCRVGLRHGRPVLFPTSDEAVQFVSNHRARLDECFRFLMPAADTLDRIIDKAGTWELARGAGVPIPRTGCPATLEAVEACSREFRFPVILKPTNTFAVGLPGRAKNLILRGADELHDLVEAQPELLGQFVLQEIIRGGDGHILICAAYFDENSNPLALYTGRKLRQYLPDYGVTCLGRSEELPEVAELTCRFVRQIGFKGLITAEWVEEVETGKLYFVEANARTYYHNILFTDCGVNLPWVAYRDLSGRGKSPPQRQRFGVVWLDLKKDLGSFWRKRQRKQIGVTEYLTSLLAARSWAFLDRRDPLPFLYSTWRFVGLGFEKLLGIFRRSRHA
jgi:predicted ATP-grasp superfamily ATP-dependent carboligase